MHNLAKNIKLLRQKRGWSQNEFATRLGISVPAFSKIENGLTDLRLSKLDHIAVVLQMSLKELLFYNNELKTSEANELHLAKETIKNYTEQVLNLQKQIIILHEEIRRLTPQ